MAPFLLKERRERAAWPTVRTMLSYSKTALKLSFQAKLLIHRSALKDRGNSDEYEKQIQ